MGGAKMVCCLLALTVAGCSVFDRSRQSGGEATLSWYCKKRDDGGQHCERRRLRDGRPVDDVVYDTLIIPGEDPAPAQALTTAAEPKTPRPSAGQAKRWDRNPLKAVKSIEDTSDLEVENLGPALKAPRQTVDMWGKHRRDQQPEPAGESTPERPEEVAEKVASAGAGYTIQLAAFSTVEQARTFMDRKTYEGLALEERRIFARGRAWWIVTHGSFSNYGEARAAASALADRFGGITPWARSLSLLARLETDG